MARPNQILCIILLTVAFCALSPPPASADDMVLFKNGRTLRADELELNDGAYRITTMSGGVMEIPVELVERVIACVVDKDVEEQRGTAPPTPPRAPGSTTGDRSKVTKIPPIGSGGGAGRVGRSPVGGGKAGGRAGGATPIPPRGGRSLGKPGDKTIPEKGGEEKK